MSRDGNRRRVLTPDERVLWTIVTKSIAPLRTSPLPLGEVDARSASGEGLQPNESHLPPHPSPLPQGERERAKSAAKVRPQPPPLAPLGRRMRARVARGKEAIDGRLDLHGLTQSEAHSALLHFLRNAIARDARLVLVITGKGRGGEPGVLRRHVPQWLGLPEFRALVIGFEDAHVSHGGEGALYVRVRRARGG
ncbi:MAG: Smr/MutS family protein [Rhizobiales bacterium]|nr:Smr/MutS family protein [Hyphomicrobiales bacterium]